MQAPPPPNPDATIKLIPPSAPMGQRAFHLLATALLSFALSILLTIVLLAKVGMMRDVIFAIREPDNGWGIAFTWFALLVIFILPLTVLVYGYRHRWLTWRVVGAAWALVIGTMIYLGQDEPVVNLPADLDEFAPVRPGDAASYQIVSRFSHTKPDVKADDRLTLSTAQLSGNETDTAVLRANHDVIEAGWNQITELREWFADMAAQPRLGDLLRKLDDPLPSFVPIRTYTRLASAHAQLLALDGHGDDALALLGQIVDVGQKLSATTRTLVRGMIGVIISKSAMGRAGYVLNHAATTPAARAKFAATLAAGVRGEGGVRRMLMIEYVTVMVPLLLDQKLGDLLYGDFGSRSSLWEYPLDGLTQVLMNPRATVNLAGAYYGEMADLGARRDFAGMKSLAAKVELEWSGWNPVKNMGGRYILSMALPALAKITEQYWQEQDARTALLVKLKALDAAK